MSNIPRVKEEVVIGLDILIIKPINPTSDHLNSFLGSCCFWKSSIYISDTLDLQAFKRKICSSPSKNRLNFSIGKGNVMNTIAEIGLVSYSKSGIIFHYLYQTLREGTLCYNLMFSSFKTLDFQLTWCMQENPQNKRGTKPLSPGGFDICIWAQESIGKLCYSVLQDVSVLFATITSEKIKGIS